MIKFTGDECGCGVYLKDWHKARGLCNDCFGMFHAENPSAFPNPSSSRLAMVREQKGFSKKLRGKKADWEKRGLTNFDPDHESGT